MEEIAPNLAAPVATTFMRCHFKHAAVSLFCIAALLASVFLYSRQIDFSSFFHPDEPLKALQVGNNKRWYLHPQLLLEATDLALKISRYQDKGTLESGHQVIVTGRWVSSIFAGLTVVALGLVGYRYGGFGGLALSTFSVGLCPSLLLYAHYMKEDTALVFGVALTLLAALTYSTAASRTSRRAALAFLGVAAGIAASGKYIGILALLAALFFVSIPSPWRDLPGRWAVILAACAATVVLINYRIFSDWNGFQQGLGLETHHILTQHGGTTMNRPNLFCAKGLVREMMPHVLFLAGIFLISLGVFWRRTSRWDLFLILFAGCFILLLSFSIVPEYRYNLPIIVMLHLMAALAIVRLSSSYTGRAAWIVTILVIALMIPLQLRRCLNYLDQFANDSRVRLRSFVAHNIPPGSVVFADSYAIQLAADDPRLAENERTLPIKLEAKNWVADFGELESVRSLGVDYIAVSDRAYGRFFDPDIHPAPGDWHYSARRRFYEKLFAEGELVWSSNPDPPTYSFVNPALRLYRISEHR